MPHSLLHLHSLPSITYKTLKKILEFYKTPKNAYQKISFKDLLLLGIKEDRAEKIIKERKNFNLEKLLIFIQERKIKTVTIFEENYPKLLKEIYDPPFILYYLGNIIPEDNFAVAVVGSRVYSPYGKESTQKISSFLAQNKVTIISGLALGIDAIAHQSAISMNGRTLAVLGAGIDQICPLANKKLAQDIINQNKGAIISEFPIGTRPEPYNFPKRNRIISGMSLGVVIPQARQKSGALITADFAIEQGREVFAVPSQVSSTLSLGTNQLIQSGLAHLLLEPKEILEILSLKQISQKVKIKKAHPGTKGELKILNILNNEPIHIDKISQLTNFPPSVIGGLLILMEIKGWVQGVGGGHFIIKF